MQTTLTITIDEKAAARAERLAAEAGTSVSKVIESMLDGPPEALEAEEYMPKHPIVRRIYGAAAGGRFDESDYKRYLLEKHS